MLFVIIAVLSDTSVKAFDPQGLSSIQLCTDSRDLGWRGRITVIDEIRVFRPGSDPADKKRVGWGTDPHVDLRVAGIDVDGDDLTPLTQQGFQAFAVRHAWHGADKQDDK